MPICTVNDCKTWALYSLPGNSAEKCGKHREPGMINVVVKKCNYEGCLTRPGYNYPSEKSGIYCNIHKKEEMINIGNKYHKCVKCQKRGIYRYCYESKVSYCADHKKEGMVNINEKYNRCICCNKISNYNYPGLKSEYCIIHKKQGMINRRDKRICIVDNCYKRRGYNYPNEEAKYCCVHKLQGMVNTQKDNRVCTIDGCSILASFGYSDRKRLYCKLHKTKDSILLAGTLCKTEHCTTSTTEKYDYYCIFCFSNLFPDDPRVKTIKKKTKEIMVKNWLYQDGHIDFIHDKSIYITDCKTNRRIDFYKYIGDSHILCIEVDENQHRGYNPIDEELRYHELYPVLDKVYHMIYIRFNPDKYIGKSGKTLNPPIEKRLEFLSRRIRGMEEVIKIGKYTKELLYIKKLYYNKL